MAPLHLCAYQWRHFSGRHSSQIIWAVDEMKRQILSTFKPLVHSRLTDGVPNSIASFYAHLLPCSCGTLPIGHAIRHSFERVYEHPVCLNTIEITAITIVVCPQMVDCGYVMNITEAFRIIWDIVRGLIYSWDFKPLSTRPLVWCPKTVHGNAPGSHDPFRLSNTLQNWIIDVNLFPSFSQQFQPGSLSHMYK